MYYLLFLFLISEWQLQNSGVTVSLHGFDCASTTECWAVGDSGIILHTTDSGANWVVQSSGTTEDLRGVDFVDNQNGWAVGYGPIHLHTTNGGASWTEVNSGSSYELFNVAFANNNRGWVTGRNGTIIGTTDGGNIWNSELAGEWAWIYGITVLSPTCAWVIGADWFMSIAPIFKYNGTVWSKQYDIVETKSGREISAADSSVIWAVGGDGVIFYTSDGGENWTQQVSGTTAQFEGVSATSPTLCWAAGADGLIMHTTNGGSDWFQQGSPVSDTLFDIVMLDEYHGWAVGGNGTILHTSDGGAGISERANGKLGSSLQLYPDPVRSVFFLSGGNIPEEQITIRLFDITGRMVSCLYNGPSKRTYQFSVVDLPQGVYILECSIPGQRITRVLSKID